MLGLTAEQIGTVILGISLGLIGLMGGQKGRQIAQGKREPDRAETIEVAGAIVSDKAVERMIKSLDEFSAAATLLKAAIDRDVEAKGKLTAAMVENSRKLDRNSDVSEGMHEQVKDTGVRLDRLKEELIRNSSAHR